jgi:phosphocarrier protein
MPSQQHTIQNPTGLHARPARHFAETAATFTSTIRVHKGPKAVNGKSVLAMLTLGAKHLDTLVLEVDGPDADDALARLGRILQQQFNE